MIYFGFEVSKRETLSQGSCDLASCASWKNVAKQAMTTSRFDIDFFLNCRIGKKKERNAGTFVQSPKRTELVPNLSQSTNFTSLRGSSVPVHLLAEYWANTVAKDQQGLLFLLPLFRTSPFSMKFLYRQHRIACPTPTWHLKWVATAQKPATHTDKTPFATEVVVAVPARRRLLRSSS